MRIAIPVLLLLGALIVAGGIAYALADDPPGDPPLLYFPVRGEPLPTVSPEESTKARSVLARDARFRQIVGDRSWRVAQELAELNTRAPRTVGLIIEFDAPFDSDGPWLVSVCQGTRSVEGPGRFRGITTLGVVVDPESGAITSLKPLGAQLDGPSEGETVKCPKGKEDNN